MKDWCVLRDSSSSGYDFPQRKYWPGFLAFFVAVIVRYGAAVSDCSAVHSAA
jgi:hypothetical protein